MRSFGNRHRSRGSIRAETPRRVLREQQHLGPGALTEMLRGTHPPGSSEATRLQGARPPGEEAGPQGGPCARASPGLARRARVLPAPGLAGALARAPCSARRPSSAGRRRCLRSCGHGGCSARARGGAPPGVLPSEPAPPPGPQDAGAPTHRGGLDAPAGLRAGPAGAVDEQVAAFALQAGPHVTPLLRPDDPRCGERRAVSPAAQTRTHPAPDSAGPRHRASGTEQPGGDATSCQVVFQLQVRSRKHGTAPALSPRGGAGMGSERSWGTGSE